MANMTTIRYRRRLAISWFIGVGLLFLQILMQYVGTMYQGHEIIPWVWFFSVVLPGTLAVGSLYIWTGQLRQQIDPTFFRILFIGLIAFVIIAIGITFLKNQFTTNEKFIFFIRDSKMFLVPIGLVLSYMTVAGFFKKKGKSSDREEVSSSIGVVDYTINAETLKSNKAALDELTEGCEAKIGAGKPNKVFAELIDFFAHVGIDDQEIVYLKSQWNTIKRERVSNFITGEQADTRQSRVISEVLKIISHLESANK